MNLKASDTFLVLVSVSSGAALVVMLSADGPTRVATLLSGAAAAFGLTSLMLSIRERWRERAK